MTEIFHTQGKQGIKRCKRQFALYTFHINKVYMHTKVFFIGLEM